MESFPEISALITTCILNGRVCDPLKTGVLVGNRVVMALRLNVLVENRVCDAFKSGEQGM